MQNSSDMAIAADRRVPLDELQALIEFVQLASGASMVIAFEANEAGLAKSLAASPQALPQPFLLGESHIEQMRCSGGAASADCLRLPAPILLALGRPATKSLFIPTPVTEAPRSGVLLLWAGEGDCSLSLHSNVEQCIAKLAQLFGQILINRRSIVKRQLMTERFYDLFESVPSGIIVIGGDCGAALVNQPAAELLGIAAGEVEACMLAAPMRALRQSCVNASALQEAYGAVIGDVDYALITLWDFGDRQFEVDTHSMKGDGRLGRIWLFHEISAQHRLEQELRGLAGTDPLTGLANRRQFSERGTAMLRQARSDERPLSVLMLDVDHFKSINDKYGHHVGDIVLKTLAQRCNAKLRDHDLMARLGGEEFAILLAGVSAIEAAAVAERLRAAVAATPVEAGDLQIHVTTSIGGTALPADEISLDDLLDRADQLLYTAKQTGRNKVEFDG